MNRLNVKQQTNVPIDLIKVLKYIIKGAGFELTERVQVKDTKTGRVYK